MTLQDKLDAFKAEFESGQLPFTLTEQEHALMRKAIQTQIAAGIAERALRVGDAAPDFTLSDGENRPCSSAALLAKGPLVVSFYRGIWCPYCTLDLQALQAALPAITQYGAQLSWPFRRRARCITARPCAITISPLRCSAMPATVWRPNSACVTACRTR